MIPWYYRWGFTNWLMAKPWRWNYRKIWQEIMAYPTARKHPIRALWMTVSFPHVHHPNEE